MNDKTWEILGFTFGFLVSVLLILQMYSDVINPEHSSLSKLALLGWIIVHAFWASYGFRFSRTAIWTSNLLAGCCQIILLILVKLGY